MPPAAGFVGKLELFRAAAGEPGPARPAVPRRRAVVRLRLPGLPVRLLARRAHRPDGAARAQQAVVARLALLVLAAGLWPEPLLALSHDAAATPCGGGAMTGILLRAAGLAGDLPARPDQPRARATCSIGARARRSRSRRAAAAPSGCALQPLAGCVGGRRSCCSRPAAEMVARQLARRALLPRRRRPARASSRSRAATARGTSVALWGVLTGEAPDEVVVDVDEARGVLIVHLVDAADPDAVRARHAGTHARWQRDGGAPEMPDVVRRHRRRLGDAAARRRRAAPAARAATRCTASSRSTCS